MKRVILLTFILLAASLTGFTQTNRAFRKGYQASVEIQNSAVFGKDKAGGMMQLSTLHGFRTGYGLFIGAGLGIGYNLLTDDYIIPLYLDAKYNFLDQKVSPFAGIRTGFRYNGSPNQTLGDFIAVSGGIDAGAFSIRIGYEYGATRQRTANYNGNNWVSDIVVLQKPSQLFCSFAVNF